MRATVYSADRSGFTWDVGEFHEPLTALWVLHAQQLLHPHRVHGIYDPNDPERGDIQTDLEDQLEFDVDFVNIIQSAVAVERSQDA